MLAGNGPLDARRVEDRLVVELDVGGNAGHFGARVEQPAIADHDHARRLAHLGQRHDLGGELRADAGGVAHGECYDGFLHFRLLQGLPNASRGSQVVNAGT